MGALSGTHEIVELTENNDYESKISGATGKHHMGKTVRKFSIEDDINKLFEAITIGNSHSHRGVSHQEHSHVRGALSKSAMKRPMRVGPSQVSGIGISESVNLKQALRGLCISQASEMAAIKKRMSRPSASPGFSEAGGIKRPYRAVVSEASEVCQSSDEGKGDTVEILLVLGRSSPNFSNKAPESEQVLSSQLSKRDSPCPVLEMDSVGESAKIAQTVTEEDIILFPITGGKLSEAEFEQNKTLGLQSSSDKKFQVLDAIVPVTSEVSVTGGKHKELVGKLQSASSTSSCNVGSKLIKTSSKGIGSSKQSLRTQNLVKKKIAPKTNIHVKHDSQLSEKPDNNSVGQTPDTIPEEGCEDMGKVLPASSSNTNMIVSSVSVDSHSNKRDLPHSGSKSKRVLKKSDERSRSKEKGEISPSSKSSIGEYSSTSYSEESYVSGSSRSGYRPHMSKDLRWEAISCVRKQHGSLGMRHFKLLRKIGGGDIGMVYLSELIGTSCLFAVKVMDNDFLASKKKMLRAQTEKEILQILDHPFLPTLYADFTTNKFSCMVMEYCPGGDLHVLRQKQPTKCFSEPAARFYVAEVLLALEYLHMLGVVYRDLKPENILVREDGHIMLSDFDLSLRCAANPTLLKSSSPIIEPQKKTSSPCANTSCIDPFCLQPSWQLSCFTPRFLSAASKTRKLKSELAAQVIPLPQLVVEPTDARSNSFVGTHEYLAPEIIKGEGHGSAVDWWTFGIFLYELLYGKTPFKGSSNEDTISNVVSQCLKFPECPMVSSHARDLIRRLLMKEPENRLGSQKGAAEIKQHPFFEGLNWALIRCETPPELPRLFDLGNVVSDSICRNKTSKSRMEFERGEDDIEFEMF